MCEVQYEGVGVDGWVSDLFELWVFEVWVIRHLGMKGGENAALIVFSLAKLFWNIDEIF